MDIGRWNEYPPVTRTLCVLIGGISLLFKQLHSLPNAFPSLPGITSQVPQTTWHTLISLLYAGSGVQLVFNLMTLYQFSNYLEMEHYTRRSPDYAWQLTVTTALLSAVMFILGRPSIFEALMFAIVYLSCRLKPSRIMHFFAIFQIPATYFMYGLAVLTYIGSGPQAGLNAAIGAAIGHLWWIVVWKSGGGPTSPGPTESKTSSRGNRWGAAPSLMGRFVSQGPDTPFRPQPPPKFGSLSSAPSFKFTAKDPGSGKYGSSCAGGRCG